MKFKLLKDFWKFCVKVVLLESCFVGLFLWMLFLKAIMLSCGIWRLFSKSILRGLFFKADFGKVYLWSCFCWVVVLGCCVVLCWMWFFVGKIVLMLSILKFARQWTHFLRTDLILYVKNATGLPALCRRDCQAVNSLLRAS